MSALAIEADVPRKGGLADETLQPGQQVGRYKIVRRFAYGGMAELYLAHAVGVEGFQKIVAIKRVMPALAMDPVFVGMFLDEARMAANLAHPNIAQVYDIGVDGHSYFFAMEYVDGRDLRHLLKEAVQRGERMPIAIAIGIATSIAAGLHAAHEHRTPDRAPMPIIHRDVSPANVLVTFSGAVKLIDFGIAKAARRRTVSVAGQLKGKAGYMSPEQCTGGTIDRRSDVFSLGILLYEMTTTRRLFRGADEYSAMKMIVDGEIKRPTQVVEGYPQSLEDIVLRALARNPDERYQSARDLHLDLVRFAHAYALDLTEYDLARYVQRILADETQQSIFDAELERAGADDSGPHPALRTPNVAPLASVPRRFARGTSLAETLVIGYDDGQKTSVFVTAAAAAAAKARGGRPPSPISVYDDIDDPIAPPPAPAAADVAPVTAVIAAPAAAPTAHAEATHVPWPLYVLALALMFVTGWLASAYVGG